jgi:hypothetical protein
MQRNEIKKLNYSDIEYHGKPIDALTREELLEAFVELAQTVVECASTNNQCKAIFTVNQDQ